MNEESAKTEQLLPGEIKAQEYAGRIIGGDETYESVIQGLGPVMISAIRAAMERRGYDVPEAESTNDETESPTAPEKKPAADLENYVAEIVAGRSQSVQELYTDWLAHQNDSKKRTKLARGLFGDTYNNLRIAEYDINPEEEATWEQAKTATEIPVKEENDWQYRGVFPERGEPTVTRGSLNVTVTPELIQSLDHFILSGAVRMNYKFGQPNTPASPQERHDAISLYFLEEPSDEVLEELVAIAQPYTRGDSLLGRKIAVGFCMSEIGSVPSEEISHLTETLDGIDTSFAEAVRQYTTRADRISMSEAQFYAIQKVAAVFGYSIEYGFETGFVVSLQDTKL